MRDDDRMLDLPNAEFGSGIIGVCDICGERQAVIVLNKERYKLCVIDFLNKTWLKTEKLPGAPAPLYRSERVWYESRIPSTGKAPAIALSPTKVIRRASVLITPDVYGLTTTLLDGAIRFAREGFEVLVPDLAKTDGIGASHHVTLRSSAQFRGGVAADSKRVSELVALYRDALEYLRGREMVEPAKSALFGVSYGGSLAMALAARDPKIAAVALAYPMPIRPADLPQLVTAPVLCVMGSADRASAKARGQLEAAQSSMASRVTFFDVPGARHHFLSRDLRAYDLPGSEAAWTAIVAWTKHLLMPPPPRPPAVPSKPLSAVLPPNPPAAATRPPAPSSAPTPNSASDGPATA
jgi:dienelactone hydrolase